MTLLGSCVFRSFPRSPATTTRLNTSFQQGAKRSASSHASSSQQWKEQAKARFKRQGWTVEDMVSDKAQCGRWLGVFLSAWGTYKHRTHTAAWERHVHNFRGGCKKAEERWAGKANRAARVRGTLLAGAPRPRVSYTQAVTRPLTGYITTQERRRHLVTFARRHTPLSLPGRSSLQLCSAVDLICEDVRRHLGVAFTALKSSELLTQLNHLSRLSFTLLPIVAGLRLKTARLIRRQGANYVARFFHPSRTLVISLFLTPFALLGLAYLASLERTPITGRVRSLFVNEYERAAYAWLFLEDMAESPEARFGAAVIPPKQDFRASLVEDTMRSLEVGIPFLGSSASQAVAGLLVPPADPLLAYSTLGPKYHVAMVDRPEANAFSFGFAPFGGQTGPGFVVVHSGYVDAIMGRNAFMEDSVTAVKEDLAVVIAHELAHLLCSHTLEVQASEHQHPRMRTIFVDALRTAVYPFTALLGPFANEYVSDLLQRRFVDPYRITSACDSRILEHEADAVSLRILANAGYDPRCTVRFWESRIAAAKTEEANGLEARETGGRTSVAHSHAGESSHPVDEERLRAIKEDLARWTRV